MRMRGADRGPAQSAAYAFCNIAPSLLGDKAFIRVRLVPASAIFCLLGTFITGLFHYEMAIKHGHSIFCIPLFTPGQRVCTREIRQKLFQSK